MGGLVAQLWRRPPPPSSPASCCARRAPRSPARCASGCCSASPPAPASSPAPCRSARLTNAALARWNGWRHRRGASWWGFDEVARHDWNQIVEAGRAIGRFDSRRLGRATSRCRRRSSSPTTTTSCPVHRQLALADRLRQASIWRVPGGHAVCTAAPERFVPALVAACTAVAGRRAPIDSHGPRRLRREDVYMSVQSKVFGVTGVRHVARRVDSP